MDRWKILATIFLCLTGFGLILTLGPRPAGAVGAGDVAIGNRVLVAQIKALCEEIKLLRAEIRELRKVIGRTAGVLPEPPRPPTIEKKPERPPRPVPTIKFTEVPGRGGGEDTQGDIGGNVVGLEGPQKYKIVLYAFTNQWYVQPQVAAPYTDINNDGTWSNWTHLGYRYAALLVRPSFKPEGTTYALPLVGQEVLAVATVAASR